MVLHNLLDQGRKKALMIEYGARLVVVLSILLSGAVGIGIVLLIPTYVLLSDTTERVAHGGDENVANVESKNARATLNAVASVQTLLDGVYGEEKVTEVVGEAFAILPSGVRVSGFAYDRTKKHLQIEGVAKDRTTIVEYVDKLEEAPRFENVTLPIANLTKHTDIPFDIGLAIATGEKKP